MALDEGTGTKRKRRRVVVDQAKVRYRSSDSGEAARYTRSKSYKKVRQRRYRKSDSGEAAAFTRSPEFARATEAAGQELARLLASKPFTDLSQRIDPRSPAVQTMLGGPAAVRIGDRAVSQIAESLLYTPAGLYEAGKAVGLDTRDVASQAMHDVGLPLKARGYTPSRTKDLGVAMGRQIAEDFTNPGENPGYLLLDLLALGSLGAGTTARLGAVQKASRRGAGARETARQAVRPDVPRRFFREGDLTVEGSYSRSALARYGQQAGDFIRDRNAQGGIVGQAASRIPIVSGGITRRTPAAKAGWELNENMRMVEALERAPAVALQRKGKRLSPAEQTALRVVEEGRTIDERIAMHQEAARSSTKARDRSASIVQVGLLRKARKYVDESSGKPALAATARPRLQKAQELVRRNADIREDILEGLTRLTPEQIEARVQAPGRVVGGARFTSDPLTVKIAAGADPQQFIGQVVRAADRGNFGRVVSVDADAGTARVLFSNRKTKRRAETDIELDQLTLERDPDARIVGEEGFKGGETRIPYERGIPGGALPAFVRGVRGSYGGLSRGRSIGYPRELPTTTHKYTGRRQLSGFFRTDVTNLVAEEMLKAQRFGAVIRGREALVKAARDVPDDPLTAIPIRVDDLRNRNLPAHVREAIDAAENSEMTKKLLRDLDIEKDIDALRREVFPDMTYDEFLRRKASGDADVEGVKWVDAEFVDASGLNAPASLLAAATRKAKGARAALTVADLINDASRVAILYLKPAYLAPNVLGNLAMNVSQQGVFAPVNLAKSARLSAKLGDEGASIVDTVMGEGLMAALRGEGQVAKQVANRLAEVWGKAVDVPFRRAAFLHEARRAGYRKLSDVRRLLEDPALRDELVQISRRANRAIIDYSRMSPIERSVIRRVVFFYPWVKGSTLYGARFPFEHPIQAAGASHLGRIGEEQATDDLGEPLGFTRGSFKVGERDGLPLVINPSSISVLQTPIELGEGLAAFAQGEHARGRELIEGLTPVLGAGLTAATGYDVFERREVDPGLRTFLGELTDGLPQKRLADRLGMDEADRGRKLYPDTPTDAWLQFAIGGAAPRPYNRAVADKIRREDERANMDPDERRLEDLQARVEAARKVYRSEGRELPKEYGQLARRRLMVTEAQEEIKEAEGIDKLTEAQRVAALIAVAGGVRELRKYHDGYVAAYHDSQGHPLDQGAHPNGPMRALYNVLYDILGFNRLSEYDEIVRAIEDKRQVERG